MAPLMPAAETAICALTLDEDALLEQLRKFKHEPAGGEHGAETSDSGDDDGENSAIISEHLQQLGCRLELGFRYRTENEGMLQPGILLTDGADGIARGSWAGLSGHTTFVANDNARSTYIQRLPVAGAIRQSQRGSIAGDQIILTQLDGKSVDDVSSVVGPTSKLATPLQGTSETTAVCPVSAQADLSQYIRISLPSGLLAVRVGSDSESAQAVRLITAALNLRSNFIMKYHIHESKTVHPRPPDLDYWGSTEPIFRPQDCPILPNVQGYVKMLDGVCRIYTNLRPAPPSAAEPANEDLQQLLPLLTKNIPSVEEYLLALKELMRISQHPAAKTLCFQRLRYLEERFSLHLLFNGNQEVADVGNNNHRDFYNVRKVDTHVHHSACMTQKHLLRFIRRKYRMEGDTIVAKNSQGEEVTLAEIFQNELGLTAWETSIDHLNVHALNSCFHRFDLFNTKYNPFGTALLREVFLKTDNHIGGRYLAELTNEVIVDLEEQKYQHVEWRISIYGHSKDEWQKLSRWIKHNKLVSKNVRWVIQVPRLYHVCRRRGVVDSMQELLANVFEPVAEAILRPQDHPEIFEMLHHTVAWDSVDDESIVSKFTTAGGNMPLPQDWQSDENPPYAYWAYYMYANIRSLNQLIQARGMNAMPYRPHCGEAGSVSHLATAGLLADGINHGIMLRKSPVLQYLYYLWQIGIAMSPLSNNALFHEINKSPMNSYFQIGLNVSLSTDDPLMFHFTDEALLEEYSVCAHVWKLSPVDLCELARNSILQSSFEPQYKRHWLGPRYYKKGPKGNRIECTNVPDIRLAYREETLKEELKFLRDVLVASEQDDSTPPLPPCRSAFPESNPEIITTSS